MPIKLLKQATYTLAGIPRQRPLPTPSCPYSVQGIFRHLLRLFSIAVLLNYPWELAQSPLYNEMGTSQYAWIHCFGSALGDGLIVLAIYFFACLIFRSWTWSYQMSARKYAFAVALGIVVGSAVESIAINVLHRWSYAPQMPMLPWLGLGIVPVVQMAILLPLTIYLARKWRR